MKQSQIERKVKMEKITEELKMEFNKIFGEHLKKIILYGSYARKDEEANSDIDIMVLTDLTKEELLKYRDKISEIMTDLSLEFDLLISIVEKNIEEFNDFIDYIPFYKNVRDEGVELYAS